MAVRIFVVLSCLNLALLPVAEPIPHEPSSSYAHWTSTEVTTEFGTSSSSSITSQSPTDCVSTEVATETSTSSTRLSTRTSLTDLSVSSYVDWTSTEVATETLTSPTGLSTTISSTYTPVSSSITLVTTAKPTNEPWSVSYAGYTSLNSLSAPAPKATALPGVRFHPDGASPGFFCEYPSLSQWESCNSADSRDCWLRKKLPSKIKERCNCTDDDGPDQIDINTDCKYICDTGPSSSTGH